MKLKKVIATILALGMTVSMLAGCGGDSGSNEGGNSNSNTQGSGNTANAGNSNAEAKEPVTVKVSYPCLVIVPPEDAVAGVEDAINKHLEEIGSGVRLDLEALDGNSYTTTIDMKQIGGEQVDLYMCLGGLPDQVASNKLQPITNYVDTALKPITDITGKTFLDATTVRGEVYGVPCYRTDVLTYYWMVEASMAENDLGIQLGDTLTVDELTEKMAILHEKYPDKIVMGVRPGANGSPNNFCLSAIYAGPDYYSVTDLNSGVCVVGDDLTVVNKYTTDYFLKVCETAYKWNQAGYVNKDASVVTEEGYDLMKADRALSYIIGYGGCDPQISDGDFDTTHGKSVMYIPIEQTLNMPSGLDWGVSYSCKNPEAACEALSLFYTDAFVMNTLLCGVEGRDWVDTGLGTSPEDKVVDFPEGQNAFTVPYYAWFTCGIMGNEYLDWPYVSNDGTVDDRRQAHKEFMQSAPASPIYGFYIDTTNIKNQVAAISNVESQYLGGLLTGEMDPAEYIPKLVSALEDAGIQDVIAEAQAQLDEWKSYKK